MDFSAVKKNTRRDLYYTTDHDWIDFQGAVAYTGVSAFKLTGFRQVQRLSLAETGTLIRAGERIATIRYHDYEIDLLMPVEGRLLETNELLVNNPQLLLQQPETAGWLFKLLPAQPWERKGLILKKDYQLNGKSKFAKS